MRATVVIATAEVYHAVSCCLLARGKAERATSPSLIVAHSPGAATFGYPMHEPWAYFMSNCGSCDV